MIVLWLALGFGCGGGNIEKDKDADCTISPTEVMATPMEEFVFSAECPQPIFERGWEPEYLLSDAIAQHNSLAIRAPTLPGTYEVKVRAYAYEAFATAEVTVVEANEPIPASGTLFRFGFGATDEMTLWGDELVFRDRDNVHRSVDTATWGGGEAYDRFVSPYLAFSPDDSSALVKPSIVDVPDDADTLLLSRARVWDRRNDTLERYFQVSNGNAVTYEHARFAPDGETLVLWDDDNFMLTRTDLELFLSATGGARVTTMEGDSQTGIDWDWGVHDARFSADGSRLYTFSDGGGLTMWNAQNGKFMRRFGGGYSFLEAPDGRFIFGDGHDIRIYDGSSFEEERALGFETYGEVNFHHLAWNQDQTVFYQASKGAPPNGRTPPPRPHYVSAFSWPGADLLWTRPAELFDHQAIDMVVLPDDSVVVARGFGLDRVIQRFDAATGDLVETPVFEVGPTSYVRYSDDGQHLATVGTSFDEQHVVRLLDPETGTLDLVREDASWFQWLDGDLILGTQSPAGSTSTFEWIDPSKGTADAVQNNSFGGIGGFALHDDGDRYAGAGGVYDALTGEVEDTWQGCAISQPLYWLADGNVAGGGVVCSPGVFGPVHEVAADAFHVSRDRTTFVAAKDTRATVVDTETGATSPYTFDGTVDCAALDDTADRLFVHISHPPPEYGSEFVVVDLASSKEVYRSSTPADVRDCVTADWRPGANDVALGTETELVVVRLEGL